MKYLVNVSGGLASAAVWRRALERFGPDNVLPCFADTMSESADTYQFLNDCEKAAGQRLTRLSQGKDIWDVFMERGMLTDPKNGGCMASYWLKKVPLEQHAKQFDNPTILVGFGPDECDRVERLVRSRPDCNFDFPLRWEPRMWACGVKNYVLDWGIENLPRAYADGMGHNNCNRNCIKGGISYWSLTWKDDLDGYLYHESREQDFLAMLRNRGRKEHTILKDRRGGKTKNMSLYQLRLELENGTRFADDSYRMPCACDVQYQETKEWENRT